MAAIDEEELERAQKERIQFNLPKDEKPPSLLEVEREKHRQRYGVDVMSTKDCLQYFGDYGPTFIEWINDSSCVVVFRDAHSARRAMAGVGRPLPSEEMAGESSAGLDPFDPANMPYFWHKGRDFIKEGTPVHLIYRMATVDVDGKGRRQQNRRGGRRRKQRNTDGTQSVVQEDGGDVVMNDDNTMGEGMEAEHRRQTAAKDRKQAGNYQLWGSKPAVEHGQQQEQQQPVEHQPGRMEAENGAEGQPPANVEALLRRIVRARRASKKGTAQPEQQQQEFGRGQAGAEGRSLEPA
ncbi:hypothetical protein DUNSADRAFT_17800 [Dunaliella salina]|uniref:Nuclear cap-binding protein subunit 3 n=1 Tax=Dunaliella salina TaxID=3046 RepID=A0ABQ7GZM4_DUNSA|nr:hypothetical protein DUNSADRAFT_17800 [Dunaliella salina]|eukprot:KAF5840065.1 hypothetical protein DUNSADRAFT_17800 [Dunaliella salina]